MLSCDDLDVVYKYIRISVRGDDRTKTCRIPCSTIHQRTLSDSTILESVSQKINFLKQED